MRMGSYRQIRRCEGGSQVSLFVGAQAWENLPKEYQAILETAAAEAHVEMQAKYDARNPAALNASLRAARSCVRFRARCWRGRGRPRNEVYADPLGEEPTMEEGLRPLREVS